MAEYVYEDGTPVPPELLPPELAAPSPEEAMYEEALGRHRRRNFGPEAMRDEELPQVGRARALGLGFESGIPFAPNVHAALTAAARTPSTPEQRMPTPKQLAAMYPGVPYTEAATRWFDENRPDVANAAQAEQDRQRRAQAFEQARGEREALQEGAWRQHPLLYGGGKLAGFTTTDVGLGALSPALSFSRGIPQGTRVVQRLVPAARAGAFQGALYGAAEAPSLEAAPGEAMRGAIGGGVLAPAGELALGGFGAARRAIVRGGQRAAVQTLGAPQGAAGNMALMRGRAGMQELGRTVQEVPGAQLRRGPQGIVEPLARAMEPVGQRLSQVADEATQAGATIDLGRVLQRFDAKLGGLAKDPMVAKRVQAVREYVAATALGRGVQGPQRIQLMQVPANEAHMMRQGLDDFIYAATEGLPPKSPVRATFRQLRRIVDDELGGAVNRTLGSEAAGEWARLNVKYHNLADANRLARAGYKRQLGAEYGAPQHLRRSRIFGIPSPFVEGPVQPSYRMMAAHARLTQPLSF